MATPPSAKKDTLAQQIRDLQQQIRALTAASLRRQQLSVTEGDFVVTGGGNVVVKDSGSVQVFYPNDGTLASALGDFYNETDGAYGGTGMLIQDSAGSDILTVSSGPSTLASSSYILCGRPTAPLQQITAWAQDVTIRANGGLFLQGGPAAQVQVGIGSAGVFIGHSTTSSAANVNLLDTGFLSRVTSSLRYKARVEDAVVDPAAVLSINGRTWVDRKDADNPEADRHIGFIAEELDEAGLTDFVVYDDEGRPDAIQYDRLSVALLAVAKAQESQLDALSARLDALEAKA